MTQEPSDGYDRRFDEDADRVRQLALAFLAEHFGPRCPDYVGGCETCDRYAALDRLTERAWG